MKKDSNDEVISETIDDDDMPELTSEDFERAIPGRPFLEAIKKPISIRLKARTLYYFQLMSKQTGIPYQTLINMYLDDCAKNEREINITWK